MLSRIKNATSNNSVLSQLVTISLYLSFDHVQSCSKMIRIEFRNLKYINAKRKEAGTVYDEQYGLFDLTAAIQRSHAVFFARTLTDLMALARSNPARLTNSSTGPSSVSGSGLRIRGPGGLRAIDLDA